MNGPKEVRAFEIRSFEAAVVHGEPDASAVEKRLLGLGCPADLAKRAQKRTNGGAAVGKTNAEIDAENVRKAAAIARELEAEEEEPEDERDEDEPTEEEIDEENKRRCAMLAAALSADNDL